MELLCTFTFRVHIIGRTYNYACRKVKSIFTFGQFITQQKSVHCCSPVAHCFLCFDLFTWFSLGINLTVCYCLFQFVAASDAFSSADPSLVPIKLPLCDLKMETRAESKAILQDVKGNVLRKDKLCNPKP